MSKTLARHLYTFNSSDGTKVVVLRGSEPPRMTGGGGGWQIVQRPRRLGLTQWQGREPYQMDVPVLFDGWADGDDVEADIARLNQMQMGKNSDPPPTLQIDGAVPVKGIRWVIAGIEWGTNVIWVSGVNGRPVRQRQDAVVKLLQYVKDDRLVISNKSTAPRRHIYKKGETLRGLAQKYYKDASKWKKIADANKIRDPRNIKPGTSLRIP